MSESLFTKKRLANYLGVTQRTIDNMRSSGEIPAHDYEITQREIKLWEPETIHSWLRLRKISK